MSSEMVWTTGLNLSGFEELAATVDQAIRRVHPGFNEAYYGDKSFTELIKDAVSRGLLRLRP